MAVFWQKICVLCNLYRCAFLWDSLAHHVTTYRKHEGNHNIILCGFTACKRVWLGFIPFVGPLGEYLYNNFFSSSFLMRLWAEIDFWNLPFCRINTPNWIFWVHFIIYTASGQGCHALLVQIKQGCWLLWTCLSILSWTVLDLQFHLWEVDLALQLWTAPSGSSLDDILLDVSGVSVCSFMLQTVLSLEGIATGPIFSTWVSGICWRMP